MTQPDKSDLYEFRPRIHFNMNETADRTIIAFLESLSSGDKSAFVNTLLRIVLTGDAPVVDGLIAEVQTAMSLRERPKPGRPRGATTRNKVAAIKREAGKGAARAVAVIPATPAMPAMPVTPADQIGMPSGAGMAEVSQVAAGTPHVSVPMEYQKQGQEEQAVVAPAAPVSDKSVGKSEDLSRLASSGLLGGASWS